MLTSVGERGINLILPLPLFTCIDKRGTSLYTSVNGAVIPTPFLHLTLISYSVILCCMVRTHTHSHVRGSVLPSL